MNKRSFIRVLSLTLVLCASQLDAQQQFTEREVFVNRQPLTVFTPSIRVINMIPNAQSNETNQDSEPNVAVDPSNTSRIVASAFTPNPSGTTTAAPIYISTNRGSTWSLNNIVPSGNGMTGDITLKFGDQGGTLYTGILLGGSGLTMNILRSRNPFGATTMTTLVNRAQVDQPYIDAITTPLVLRAEVMFTEFNRTQFNLPPGIFIPPFLLSRDRLFVGNNDLGAGTLTATVDHSASARTAAAPAGITNTVIETRATNGQDRPSVRASAHADGTVYGLFARTTANNGVNRTTDVTVVRDDTFATGTNPFTALTGGDGNSGVLVATGVNMPFINAPALGQNRLGSHMSLVVDPTDSDVVYIAWSDRPGTAGTTLHVRRSGDRGVTWSNDVLGIANAINPALAVNSMGVVGIVFQQLTGPTANQLWETHFQRSADGGQVWNDMVLSSFQDNNPAPAFQPYLGDYTDLMSVGRDFYGVFSASNLPDMDNFPEGVTYQRNADFTNNVLRNTTDTGNVAVSIDPFFFQFRYGLDICSICPACCATVVMDPDQFVLECSRGDFCQIRDPIPKNCLVKFNCPGCSSTGMCPPYYHVYLDDFDPEDWNLDLRTGGDQPVNFELNTTNTGVVVSFRPDPERFEEGSIGDYQFVFDARSSVKPETKYRIGTRLEVSDFRYQQHLRYGLDRHGIEGRDYGNLKD